MLNRFVTWTKSLQANGILQAVERLKPSSEGATVRQHPSGVVAVEGPYAEAEDAVIGIFLVQAADQNAAHAIAKECPILIVGGSVEVRETEVFTTP